MQVCSCKHRNGGGTLSCQKECLECCHSCFLPAVIDASKDPRLLQSALPLPPERKSSKRQSSQREPNPVAKPSAPASSVLHTTGKEDPPKEHYPSAQRAESNPAEGQIEVLGAALQPQQPQFEFTAKAAGQAADPGPQAKASLGKRKRLSGGDALKGGRYIVKV